MSDQDPLLGLVDDLIELTEGSSVVAVDVKADGFSVALRRRPGTVRTAQAASASASSPGQTSTPAAEVVRVKAPAVGIYASAREWSAGDTVAQGETLGGVQSLGHVAEVTAPCDARVREVLLASGAPVEYGQPLFALERT